MIFESINQFIDLTQLLTIINKFLFLQDPKMPLFQSELQELMTNRIISNSDNHRSHKQNKSLRYNPALLLDDPSKRDKGYEPIFGQTTKDKNSIFDNMFNDRNFDFQTSDKPKNYEYDEKDKRTLLYTHRFLKYSSYFRDEYDQQDHAGQYEEVDIGGEIYRVKKKIQQSTRRRNRYKPLPPAPKRRPVSSTISEMSQSQVTGNQEEFSNFQDVESQKQVQKSVQGQSEILSQRQKIYRQNYSKEVIQEREKKRLNKGIQYEKYCLQTTTPEQLGKYYNRIISFPKVKQPLPSYLKSIKDELKKKYKQVFADEDKSSSSEQSSDESDEELREQKKDKRLKKKEQKLRKQNAKDVCEIVGQNRIFDTHRWGNKKEYEKYLKKKDYDERLKKMNEEKMKKMVLTQKVNKKSEQNKERHQFIAQMFNNNNPKSNQINLDEDENEIECIVERGRSIQDEKCKNVGNSTKNNQGNKLSVPKSCIISLEDQEEKDEDCVFICRNTSIKNYQTLPQSTNLTVNSSLQNNKPNNNYKPNCNYNTLEKTFTINDSDEEPQFKDLLSQNSKDTTKQVSKPKPNQIEISSLCGSSFWQRDSDVLILSTVGNKPEVQNKKWQITQTQRISKSNGQTISPLPIYLSIVSSNATEQQHEESQSQQ